MATKEAIGNDAKERIPKAVKILIPSTREDKQPVKVSNGQGDLALIPRDLEVELKMPYFNALKDAVESQLVEKTIDGEKVVDYRPVNRFAYQVLGYVY